VKRRRLLAGYPLHADHVVSARGESAVAVLKVGAALPDPPFEFVTDASPAGFDIPLMQHIASQLGRTWQLVRYTGATSTASSPAKNGTLPARIE
jgi:ABC-type amino acid transport substrate-binding protein